MLTLRYLLVIFAFLGTNSVVYSSVISEDSSRLASDMPLSSRHHTKRDTSQAENRFVNSANSFALNFLQNYPPSNAQGNIVFSPLSIHVVLDMILMGTNSNSKSHQQLTSTLGYNKQGYKNLDNEPHDELKSLLQELNKYRTNKQLIFDIESMLLSNGDEFKLKEDYKQNLTQIHDICFEETSKSNAKKANLHEQINEWIAKKTNNQIQHMVESSDIANAIALFVNAAYFRGNWAETFHRRDYKLKFYNHGNDTEAKEIQFMKQQNRFQFADFSKSNATTICDCKVLSMSFETDEDEPMSMVFLLPTKRDGLAELKSSLSTSKLNEIYKHLHRQFVDVLIPKFSFDTLSPAKQILQSTGLKSVFSFSNDFEKMSSQPKPLKIDDVIHKAKIAIDEHGAEAAAATIAKVVPLSLTLPVDQPPLFKANHPFLFIIRDNKHNLPLFIGQLTQL